MNDFLEYVIELDIEAVQKGLFSPTVLIGIYRKSNEVKIKDTASWTDKEIKFNLYAK